MEQVGGPIKNISAVAGVWIISLLGLIVLFAITYFIVKWKSRQIK